MATEKNETDYQKLYEELRVIIDGGSESMTHADAVAELLHLTAPVDKDPLKLALEALERERNNYFHGETDGAPEYLYEAITAVKKALSQPKHEPDDLSIAYMAGLHRGKELAPQRTWVGLTDEEKQKAVWTDGSFGSGALWANEILMEKNT